MNRCAKKEEEMPSKKSEWILFRSREEEILPGKSECSLSEDDDY